MGVNLECVRGRTNPLFCLHSQTRFLTTFSARGSRTYSTLTQPQNRQHEAMQKSVPSPPLKLSFGTLMQTKTTFSNNSQKFMLGMEPCLRKMAKKKLQTLANSVHSTTPSGMSIFTAHLKRLGRWMQPPRRRRRWWVPLQVLCGFHRCPVPCTDRLLIQGRLLLLHRR